MDCLLGHVHPCEQLVAIVHSTDLMLKVTVGSIKQFEATIYSARQLQALDICFGDSCFFLLLAHYSQQGRSGPNFCVFRY